MHQGRFLHFRQKVVGVTLIQTLIQNVHLALMAAIAVDFFPDNNKHRQTRASTSGTSQENKRPCRLCIRSVYSLVLQ